MSTSIVLCVFLVFACSVSGNPYHPRMTSRADAQVNPEEFYADFWMKEAQAGIRQRASQSGGRGKARNVVVFLGDGMSVPTMAAARTLLGQRQGRTGEESQLAFEMFPAVGLSKTYCVDQQIPDSSCTATAFMTGVKNNAFMLGLTGSVRRRDCEASVDPNTHLESIAAWALKDGRDAGIVTTTRITDASPAAAYAWAAERSWENDATVKRDGFDTDRCPDIAHQLVHMHPGNKFKVILGGGRQEFIQNDKFDEEGTPGKRTDGRNLIQEWQDDKRNRNASFAYVWNKEQLDELSQTPPEYLLGLFEGDHMKYRMEANKTTEPSLADLTEIAIRSLSRNEKGFFLFVESGRIDHAHHENYVHLALDETIVLSEAVERATSLLSDDDSLIVVTSDHAHVMAFNGYRRRGGDILGTTDLRDLNRVPSMTLSYSNGPGARLQQDNIRIDVTNDPDFGDLRWRSHADVPLRQETHGGDDVAVFARGPHHDMFSGLYEQSRLPHLMAYAGCFGPGKHACENNSA